jgi:hypothetical protein
MMQSKLIKGRAEEGLLLSMGWLIALFMALSPGLAVAEIGPALTGLTGRANDATSVFLSPAGITILVILQKE